MARQLQSWGVGQGDRVVLLSENRPEWAVTDFATLLLGGIVVPIYATQTAEQVLYVLQHSEARIAVVSSRKQFEKVRVGTGRSRSWNESWSWTRSRTCPTFRRCSTS